jgi:TatD DNase family protein
LIDSHCHLAGDEFDADRHAVIDRARSAGLTGALVILGAGDQAERARARQVREIWAGARFSVGIHPHQAGSHAADIDAGLATLDADLTTNAAVALGEIGLDYHYDFSPRDVQQEVFIRQIRLARSRGLPIVIHTREATDDTFRILRDEAAGIPTVFHCFTGDRDMARAALDLGAWLSFAGIVTFPKALELREVARMAPADRLLVETDAPYLAPVPHRGKRNEPAFVTRVVETLAEVRGTGPGDIAGQTAANFASVFLNPRQSNGLAR